jgi:hypothetical protein
MRPSLGASAAVGVLRAEEADAQSLVRREFLNDPRADLPGSRHRFTPTCVGTTAEAFQAFCP